LPALDRRSGGGWRDMAGGLEVDEEDEGRMTGAGELGGAGDLGKEGEGDVVGSRGGEAGELGKTGLFGSGAREAGSSMIGETGALTALCAERVMAMPSLLLMLLPRPSKMEPLLDGRLLRCPATSGFRAWVSLGPSLPGVSLTLKRMLVTGRSPVVCALNRLGPLGLSALLSVIPIIDARAVAI
jgi:hypothetical protein